ncbi:hypothetical protein AB0B25_03015 [Nocardia sp. NPDC049190]|uniref:hypothetical protein n=1 Tax=Nocardia sp. NPDC049190 TaxID=3155650 RepID=UPI00340AA621
MNVLPSDVRDLWLVHSRDCAQEPIGLNYARARFICTVHGGHGANCRQYSAASAYCVQSSFDS